MMVNNIQGADLEALDRLRSTLESRSSELGNLTSQVSAAVASLDRLWDGPDSLEFRRTWATVHRPKLVKATSELMEAGATIERNRQAQEATSTADGSAGAATSTTGERRDLEDPELAGEKVERWWWADGYDHDDLTYQQLSPEEYGLYGKPEEEVDPSLTDIDQGSLGDCWFLTGLGAVAHSNPDLIEQNVKDNMDGTYTVTFYEKQADGSFVEVEVTVDDTFPSNESGPQYARPSSGGATWAMVYEKAYAEYAGGYDDIEGGSSQDSLELLTGQVYEREDPNNLTDEELIASLSEPTAAVGMINPDTDDPSDQDVADIANFVSLDMLHSHQYVVERTYQDSSTGEWMVQLYNPHGPKGTQPGPLTLDEFRSVSDELNTPTT